MLTDTRLRAAFICMEIQENETVMKGRKRFKGNAQLQRIIEYLVNTDTDMSEMPCGRAQDAAKNTLCHEDSRITPQWPIQLIQNGIDKFTVKYGKQVDAGLNYSQAAAKYGQAIMHALACQGKLDNRERGEK